MADDFRSIALINGNSAQSASDTCRVVIIGGGFCGAVVAVQLARMLPADANVTIDVVEPRPQLGAGVAYSATDAAHRINVPAARMTVFEDDPAQFDRWCHGTGALLDDPASVWIDGAAFPQRNVFGRYIAGLVAEAAAARLDIPIRHRQTRVVDVAALQAGFTLTLEQDDRLAADMVVLAVSHPPPSVPGVLQAMQAAGGPVITDPWRPGALGGIAPDAAVLVVGTGLTMADVVASLEARGHAGPILAISRRGLLSRGHPAFDVGKTNWFGTCTPPSTALGLARAIRRQVALAQRDGKAWQGVFDDVRNNAGRLWSALSATEQRRVVRHLRPFWDVHRFRVAPQLEAAIQRMRGNGRFRVLAASLLAAEWDPARPGAGVEVTLRRRGAGTKALVHERVDAVVVTTGPAHGSALTLNPALAALAQQGLVHADAAGLGIEVNDQSQAVGRQGARRDLLVVGPLARGRFGELMGLPQVSQHAHAVAAAVTGFVADQVATRTLRRHDSTAAQPAEAGSN